MKRHVLALLVVALSGCGSFFQQQARCDLRPRNDQCTDIRDFIGPSLITFEGVCTTLIAAHDNEGSYTANARCDSENALGGCQSKSVEGSKQTNWYYAGDKYKTEDDVRAKCDDDTEFVKE